VVAAAARAKGRKRHAEGNDDEDGDDDDDGYDGYDDAGGGDAGSGDSAWGDEVVNLTPPLSLFCFAASCCPSSLLPLALRSPPL